MTALRNGDVLIPVAGSDRDDPGPRHLRGEVATLTRPEVKKPPLYKVLILNDDYTPMEFVVHVLQEFFGLNQEKATQIMLAVHTTGSAVCGVYPRDVAFSKSSQVNAYAQQHQHPLLSKVEADSD